MNGTAKRAAVIAALAAGVTLVGCRQDGPAGTLTGAPQELREGARITAILTETIELTDGMGRLATRSSTPSAQQASLRDGFALGDGGVVLATTRAMPQQHRMLETAAPNGSRYRTVIEAPNAQPAHRVLLYRDGELQAEAGFEWAPRPGGWVLSDRTVALYHGGRQVLLTRRSAANPDVALGRGQVQLLRSLSASATAALLPAPLLASTACERELVDVGIAATAVAASLKAVLTDPSNELAWAALGTSLYKLDLAYKALLNCAQLM